MHGAAGGSSAGGGGTPAADRRRAAAARPPALDLPAAPDAVPGLPELYVLKGWRAAPPRAALSRAPVSGWGPAGRAVRGAQRTGLYVWQLRMRMQACRAACRSACCRVYGQSWLELARGSAGLLDHARASSWSGWGAGPACSVGARLRMALDAQHVPALAHHLAHHRCQVAAACAWRGARLRPLPSTHHSSHHRSHQQPKERHSR